MKGDVDPDESVVEEEDQNAAEDDTIKHQRKLTRLIAPPASLHHITTELTQHVSHVTYHVHRQFTEILGVYCIYIHIYVYLSYM